MDQNNPNEIIQPTVAIMHTDSAARLKTAVLRGSSPMRCSLHQQNIDRIMNGSGQEYDTKLLARIRAYNLAPVELRIRTLATYITSRGINVVDAAAILGCCRAESELKSIALESVSALGTGATGALGLTQWDYISRQAGLYNFAQRYPSWDASEEDKWASVYDYLTQVDFLLLGDPYCNTIKGGKLSATQVTAVPDIVKALISQPSLYKKVSLFCFQYQKPNAKYARLSERYNYALSILKTLTSN